MTAKCSDADFENAIQAYVAGEGAEKVAARFHTSYKRLTDELKRRGLFRSRAEQNRLRAIHTSETSRAKAGLPVEEIASRYLAGESENSLAKHFNISRGSIRLRLEEAGVTLRSNTEANRLLADQTPMAEHHRRIKIAQEASKGVPHTREHQCKIAKTREERQTHVSRSERLLAEWLQSHGLSVTPQKAVGPYNVDIATNSIAVEIFGGAWHMSRTTHTDRARYILNSGWHLVIVWTHARRSPLEPAVADYIASFAQESSLDETPIRQYRVIRGDGQELTRGSSDSDDITIVVPGIQSIAPGASY